jgi:hypothetical protein
MGRKREDGERERVLIENKERGKIDRIDEMKKRRKKRKININMER